MPDAFIYDAVRTPRGRGKQDGALHEVSTLGLASTALKAIKDRNHLDTQLVDDVRDLIAHERSPFYGSQFRAFHRL